MRTHLTTFVGLLAVGAMASAEPQKGTTSRPAPQPAKIVMASADPVRTPTPSKSAAIPAKRPTGRVATCRCGDPAPGTESQEQ